MFRFATILTLCSLSLNFVSAANGVLQAAVVISRHGDRTPITTYPNDPYKDRSNWPTEFGELTNIGKVQEYNLGVWLRNRYATFIPAEYSSKDIRVRATDVDRTLMSALANLAGFYPPTPQQTWNENLRWQPIPVHTTPEIEDAVISTKKPCPAYDRLLKDLFITGPFQNHTAANLELYGYLTASTGAVVSNLRTLSSIYDTLFIEELYNFTLPAWTRSVYPDRLLPNAVLSQQVLAYTPKMARLKTGLLFNEILAHFRSAAGGDTNKGRKKLLWYAGHDTTIVNVLKTLGAFDSRLPEYASAILLELYKRIDGGRERYVVNVVYKKRSEDLVATNVTIAGCEFDCDLERFAQILEPIQLTPEQREIECHA